MRVGFAGIKAVTREDLVAWHRQYYHPNRILLGVVGDFSAAEMKAQIERSLGSVYGSLGAGYHQPGLLRAGLQTK